MAQKIDRETILASLQETLEQLKQLQKTIWVESDSYASMNACIGDIENSIYELHQCKDEDLI